MHGFKIHDIPELYRRKPIVTDLAVNVGEVITVELNPRGESGDFSRARVWPDVRKELTRFVTINSEGLPTVVMRVKFEKVPQFCAIYGLIGHVQEECGSVVHLPRKVCFGKWMLADTTWNHAQLRPNEVPLRQPRASMGRGETSIGQGG
jgi:hypothetical protein